MAPMVLVPSHSSQISVAVRLSALASSRVAVYRSDSPSEANASTFVDTGRSPREAADRRRRRWRRSSLCLDPAVDSSARRPLVPVRIDVVHRAPKADVAMEVDVLDVDVAHVRVVIEVRMSASANAVVVFVGMGVDVRRAGVVMSVDMNPIHVIGVDDIRVVTMGVGTSGILIAGVGVVSVPGVRVIRVVAVDVIVVAVGAIRVIAMVGVEMIAVRDVAVIPVGEICISVVLVTGVGMIDVRLGILVPEAAVSVVPVPVVHMIGVTAEVGVIGVIGDILMVGMPGVGVIFEGVIPWPSV